MGVQIVVAAIGFRAKLLAGLWQRYGRIRDGRGAGVEERKLCNGREVIASDRERCAALRGMAAFKAGLERDANDEKC